MPETKKRKLEGNHQTSYKNRIWITNWSKAKVEQRGRELLQTTGSPFILLPKSTGRS
jgi:hypothetical protein